MLRVVVRMTLSFHEIGLRFPDAVVLWDRDVAPTLDWEPRFVERDGVLWAVHGTCLSNDPLVFGPGTYFWMQGQSDTHRWNCRCLAWCDDAWISQPAYIRRSWSTRGTRGEWFREFMGRWQDDHPFYRSDMADALAYGIRYSRTYPQPRWPTLRRVLGRNQPR